MADAPEPEPADEGAVAWVKYVTQGSVMVTTLLAVGICHRIHRTWLQESMVFIFFGAMIATGILLAERGDDVESRAFFSQYFSGVDQYFVAGVETLWEQGFMPLGMKVDKHYYLDRLSKVRAKYNFNGTMTNVRQVQLPPVTNDGEKPWKAAAIALGSVLATVLIGAVVVWVVRRASGNAGGVEVATHQL